MTNIDQIREKFTNYEFKDLISQKSDNIFVNIKGHIIPYNNNFSMAIHDSITLLLENCKEFDFIDNKFVFKFPLFKIVTDLCTCNLENNYGDEEYIHLPLKDYIENYIIINEMAKVLNKRFYNYNIDIDLEFKFIISFGKITTDSLMLSKTVHDNIVSLKEFLDANGKSDETDEKEDIDCISYEFDDYSIIIGFHGYEIETEDKSWSVFFAQEIIDYVKEHSPQLFINKLANIKL